MPAISVRNLIKQYKNARAVDDVSFDVQRGTITALLGGNGAGKTTTIAMLLGALTPTSGSITVLNQDMVKNRYPALQRMNFSSPYVDLPRKLTVRQNLRVYGKLYNVPRLEQHIEDMMRGLDLADFIVGGTIALAVFQFLLFFFTCQDGVLPQRKEQCKRPLWFYGRLRHTRWTDVLTDS